MKGQQEKLYENIQTNVETLEKTTILNYISLWTTQIEDIPTKKLETVETNGLNGEDQEVLIEAKIMREEGIEIMNLTMIGLILDARATVVSLDTTVIIKTARDHQGEITPEWSLKDMKETSLAVIGIERPILIDQALKSLKSK